MTVSRSKSPYPTTDNPSDAKNEHDEVMEGDNPGMFNGEPSDPGRTFRDKDYAPELVIIAAGEFMMGSSEDEIGRNDTEGPQHRVVIPKPFAVGTCPVTFIEFEYFVQESGYTHSLKDRGLGRGARPVIDVSWDHAEAYLDWLSDDTGAEYRLPSEAEWEYACRAGTTTPFSFGETIDAALANYDANYVYGDGSKGVYREKPLEVRTLPANPFGLYEMHGNVREWVADWWNDTYEGAPTDGGAWLSGDSDRRVLRGGSWYNSPSIIRSAYRNWESKIFIENDYGFRVVRTLEA